MPNTDPIKSVENIVQLPHPRRVPQMPTLQPQRAQPTPPVLFESWVAARDRVAALLLGGTKRLVLTGPAGTGKTVLVEHAARVLRAAGRAVIIQLADADPAPPGPGVTLFVDEADRLSAPKLKRLCDESAGTVVLAGLEPLVRRAAAGTAQVRLEPLGPSDAQQYIAEWLALNGRTTAELDSAAVRALVALSGGVPRLLSTLLSAGAWLATSSGAASIEAAHIQEAAELRSVLGPPQPADAAMAAPPPARQSRVIWSALLAGTVRAGTVAAIVPRLFPAATERAVARATPLSEQAAQWLRAEPRAPSARPVQAAVQAAPVEPARAVPPPAATPIASEPPKPAVELPQPVPVQTLPEHAASLPAPAPKPPAPTLPVETVEFLLRRGREMLAIDDLSAARLLFLRAAESGSPEAMVELGRTYDPAVRTSTASPGQSNRAEALHWYHQAADKGYAAAEKLLAAP